MKNLGKLASVNGLRMKAGNVDPMRIEWPFVIVGESTDSFLLQDVHKGIYEALKLVVTIKE